MASTIAVDITANAATLRPQLAVAQADAGKGDDEPPRAA